MSYLCKVRERRRTDYADVCLPFLTSTLTYRLQALNLSCNVISETGLYHLLPALFRVAPNLEALLLDSNSLGNGGMRVLARELQSGLCPQLKVK